MIPALLNAQRRVLSKTLLQSATRNKSVLPLKLVKKKVKVQSSPPQIEEISPLKGKNVVYIGGYGGIGIEACKEMASKGIKRLTIMGCKSSLTLLDEIQEQNRDLAIHYVHINPENGIESLKAGLDLSLEYMGHIDVLINSITITKGPKYQNMENSEPNELITCKKVPSTFDDFKKNLNLLHENINSTTYTAIPLMSKEYGGNGGVIVNISSVYGLDPKVHELVYAAVKQDVIDTTRVFAQQYEDEDSGLCYLGICPSEQITYVIGQNEANPSNLPAIVAKTAKLKAAKAKLKANAKTYHKISDLENVKSIITAIENAKNGSVWVSDSGKLSEIKFNIMDNIDTSYTKQMKARPMKEDAVFGSNFYTFQGATTLMPTYNQSYSKRNFSAKEDDKNPNAALQSSAECFDSPYAECVASTISSSSPKKHNNEEVDCKTGDRSTSPINWNKISLLDYLSRLLPVSTAFKNTKRTYSATDSGKSIECDSPYCDCNRSESEQVTEETTTSDSMSGSSELLNWNRFAKLREKAKLAINKKFFTDKTDVSTAPNCLGQNPAFVGSFSEPKPCSPYDNANPAFTSSTYTKLSNVQRNKQKPDPLMIKVNIEKIFQKKRNQSTLRKVKSSPNSTVDPILNIAIPITSEGTAFQTTPHRGHVPTNALPPPKFTGLTDQKDILDFQKDLLLPANLKINILSKPDKRQQLQQLQLIAANNERNAPISTALQDKNVALFGGYYGVPLVTCNEMAKRGIKNLIILGGNSSTKQVLKSTHPNLNVDYIPFRRRRIDRTAIDSALAEAVKCFGNIDVLVHGYKIRSCYCPKMAISNCLRCVSDTESCALPFMSREYGHKGGSIINLTSIVGLEPLAFPAIHKAVRKGIINFTKTFASKNFHKRSGITHMSICPGENILATFGKYTEATKSHDLAKTKFETASDCAKVIVSTIENAENGTVWVIDMDKSKKIKIRKVWDSTA